MRVDREFALRGHALERASEDARMSSERSAAEIVARAELYADFLRGKKIQKRKAP